MADQNYRRSPENGPHRSTSRSRGAEYSTQQARRRGYPNQQAEVSPYAREHNRFQANDHLDASQQQFNSGQRTRRGAYQNQGRSGAYTTQTGRMNGDQYRNFNRYTQPQPKKRKIAPLIVFLVMLLAIGGGIFFWLENRTITVSVNGIEHEIKGSPALSLLVEEGYANPKAGNLMAIDGSLLTEGEGNKYEATVNGEPVSDPERTLENGDEVIITDGADTTEDIVETTEPIPFETVGEQGWGPIHVAQQGTEGTMLIKTGAVSGIQQTEVAEAPKNKGYVKYYPDTGDDKVIALTLDDGPWGDTTSEILDILAENDVKATFFTIGEQIDNSETGAALVKRAYDAGHQICTHTYSHASGSGQGVNLGYMTAEEQINEVTKGLEAIERATGAEASKVFRSPGGNYNTETEQILEPYITSEIGWSIDSNDWRLPGADAMVANITSSATSGDIILMHDGGGDRSQTVEALRRIIPQLKEQGFTFVTMDQLLEYPAKPQE